MLAWQGNSITKWVTAVFDLQNGAALTEHAQGADAGNSYVNAYAVALANGWFRLVLTAAVADTTAYAAAEFVNSATPTHGNYGDVTFTGNGTDAVFLGDAQLEAGSVATSPIPTFGSMVTRAADNINVATSKFPLSYAAGTLLLDWALFTLPSSAGPYGASISDGTINNIIHVSRRWATGLAGANVSVGNTAQADLTAGGSFTVNVRKKQGFAWATNDFVSVDDGSNVQTDASGSVPASGLTVLRVGVAPDGGSTSPLTGRINSLVYLPRRMTNSELQLKTAA
jgi:hypothetical protein